MTRESSRIRTRRIILFITFCLFCFSNCDGIFFFFESQNKTLNRRQISCSRYNNFQRKQNVPYLIINKYILVLKEKTSWIVHVIYGAFQSIDYFFPWSSCFLSLLIFILILPSLLLFSLTSSVSSWFSITLSNFHLLFCILVLPETSDATSTDYTNCKLYFRLTTGPASNTSIMFMLILMYDAGIPLLWFIHSVCQMPIVFRFFYSTLMKVHFGSNSLSTCFFHSMGLLLHIGKITFMSKRRRNQSLKNSKK